MIERLYKQLGHPGNEKLVRALRNAKMDESLIQCAKACKYGVCTSMAQHKLEKPAVLRQASPFNQILEADIFHLKWVDRKVKVLAILDVFSKYELYAMIQRKTEDEELQVLKEWISIFGPPEKFRTDSLGAHMRQKYL